MIKNTKFTLGIGNYGIEVIKFMGTKDWISRREICRALDVNPANLSKHFSVLMGKNFVENKILKRTGRKKPCYRLTEKGKTLSKHIKEIIKLNREQI